MSKIRLRKAILYSSITKLLQSRLHSLKAKNLIFMGCWKKCRIRNEKSEKLRWRHGLICISLLQMIWMIFTQSWSTTGSSRHKYWDLRIIQRWCIFPWSDLIMTVKMFLATVRWSGSLWFRLLRKYMRSREIVWELIICIIMMKICPLLRGMPYLTEQLRNKCN